jgi:predicted transcriptional regulator
MPKTGKIGKSAEEIKQMVADFVFAESSGVTVNEIAKHINTGYQNVYRYTKPLCKEGIICKCMIRRPKVVGNGDKYLTGYMPEV